VNSKSGQVLSSILLPALIALLAVAWWSERVIDTSDANNRAVDITTEHFPVFHAGFSRIRTGELPLWNPDQLAGMPFMAVPWTGFLYPGNLAYIATDDVAFAIEATELTHVVFGGVCMFCFVLAIGLSRLAGVAAALSFMMSGWIASQINFPVLVQGMMYLPATVLAVACSLRASRLVPSPWRWR
jgi:hypothetical protein